LAVRRQGLPAAASSGSEGRWIANACGLFAENLCRDRDGAPLLNLVDRTRGYSPAGRSTHDRVARVVEELADRLVA
jgi:hypothetical protein